MMRGPDAESAKYIKSEIENRLRPGALEITVRHDLNGYQIILGDGHCWAMYLLSAKTYEHDKNFGARVDLITEHLIISYAKEKFLAEK
jgi:hypothetical protein